MSGRLRKETGRWRAIKRIKKGKESDWQMRLFHGECNVAKRGKLGAVLGRKREYRWRMGKSGVDQTIHPGAGISCLVQYAARMAEACDRVLLPPTPVSGESLRPRGRANSSNAVTNTRWACFWPPILRQITRSPLGACISHLLQQTTSMAGLYSFPPPNLVGGKVKGSEIKYSI